MFLVMRRLLRHGVDFLATLAACSVLTFVLYLGTIGRLVRIWRDIVMQCKIFCARKKLLLMACKNILTRPQSYCRKNFTSRVHGMSAVLLYSCSALALK